MNNSTRIAVGILEQAFTTIDMLERDIDAYCVRIENFEAKEGKFKVLEKEVISLREELGKKGTVAHPHLVIKADKYKMAELLQRALNTWEPQDQPSWGMDFADWVANTTKDENPAIVRFELK